MRTLKNGLNGPDVQAWNEFLAKNRLLAANNVNDKFDKATVEATMKFQGANRLKVTGEVDNGTLQQAQRIGFKPQGNGSVAVVNTGLSSQPFIMVVVLGARADGGDGRSILMFLTRDGEIIGDAKGNLMAFETKCVGVNGSNRMNKYADTPFGVYQYEYSEGGTNASELGKPYGTGKIRMFGVWGEIIESKRTEIRVHGGGSGLKDPYTLEVHELKPTKGCVRIQNRDVISLIQAVKSSEERHGKLGYLFVGTPTYLNMIASNDRVPGFNLVKKAINQQGDFIPF